MRESEKVLATRHKSNTGKNEEKGPAILVLRKMEKKLEKVKCKRQVRRIKETGLNEVAIEYDNKR